MPSTNPHIQQRWNTNVTHHDHASYSPDISACITAANQVHDALCAPDLQEIGPYQFATSIIPARFVSGDFVLAFEQRGAWHFALGDLMGKGLAAAMWLTHVVDLIRHSCEQHDELPTIMGRLNYDMYRSRVGVPLTSLFLARLDPADSRITYSCGGCPAAFLLTQNGCVDMLDRGGPVLGALEHATYNSASFTLSPAQLFVAVSDGVTEVHHGMDFELRPDRVVKHLQFTAGDSADSIVRSLTDKVRSHSPVLTDDISIMALQRTA